MRLCGALEFGTGIVVVDLENSVLCHFHQSSIEANRMSQKVKEDEIIILMPPSIIYSVKNS